jgi:hypothetical protein
MGMTGHTVGMTGMQHGGRPVGPAIGGRGYTRHVNAVLAGLGLGHPSHWPVRRATDTTSAC